MVAIALICASAQGSAQAADDPPELLSFSIMHIVDDYWLLYGEVDDELPEYCDIFFGGVLEGCETTAEYDGTFSYVVELPPSLVGPVSAQAFDIRDHLSNTLYDYLWQ
jgi:hypothetical protein